MYEEVNLAELIERNLPMTLCISDTVLILRPERPSGEQTRHGDKELGTADLRS